ncbi:hypothetical protein EXIGLDRAFT_718811, partial [Exidia glandulosa HHB12029]
LESLIVLPENERWWHWLSERLESVQMWTIPAAVSIFWVILALVFTLVDSIASPVIDISNHGHAVGAVWLWLIPVVAGWLQAGFESHPSRVAREVDHINDTSAFVAPAQLQGDSDSDAPVLVRDQTVHHAIVVDTRQYRDVDSDCPAPIFAYARVFRSSEQIEHVALMCERVCENLSKRIPVASGRREWASNSHSNLRGTVSEVIRFCSPRAQSHWAPGVWKRIFYASVTAIAMQWVTTGAGIYITYLTPTVGLGCRSGSFLAYGLAATLAWILLLLSSILNHASVSTYTPGAKRRPNHILDTICTLLSFAGKSIAAANAVWLVTLCIFQFSGFYSTCYCMSSAWSLGKDAYAMLGVTWDELVQLGTRTVWVMGVVSTGLAASLYAAFIYFVLSPEE